MSKIALITTTINVPRVLELYAKLGPEVRFFVAMDEKTPDYKTWKIGAGKFCLCMTPDYQKATWPKSSELTGWNTDSRRNIALLEAVKWGADIIVSIDDDMLPWGFDFFQIIETTLTQKFSGLQVGVCDGGWVDIGDLTIPAVPQRGLPLVGGYVPHEMSFVVDADIGAMQGIILGVPDTDAASMAAGKNLVHSSTDILRNGLVAHPAANAVFNSQFTAFRRELAPCFAQFYKWQGRNTDIFASLIMRRVMREHNLHTYFGPPFAFHARTPRDPLKDMKAEQWGLEHVVDFARILDQTDLPHGATVIGHLQDLWGALMAHEPQFMHAATFEASRVFLEDMDSVL